MMPKWWEYSYDVPFLHGVDRYGFSRNDCFIEDPDLPFKAIHEEYLKSLEVRKEKNLESAALVDGKFEERFWMRDSVAMKRFELLITLALDPSMGPPKVGRPKIKEELKSAKSDSSDPIVSTKANHYAPKVSSKLASNTARQSDTDDTDEMLATASDITKHKKKSKQVDVVTSAPELDETAISSQLEDLKSKYKEEGRLPSLASLISEDGVPVVFEHDAPEAPQYSDPQIYLEDHHQAYHIDGAIGAPAPYGYEYHYGEYPRDEYGRPYHHPHDRTAVDYHHGSGSYEGHTQYTEEQRAQYEEDRRRHYEEQHRAYEGYQPGPAPTHVAAVKDEYIYTNGSSSAHKRTSSTTAEVVASKKVRSD